MIPIFPEFKKLEVSDQEIINTFTSRFAPYSDFNFVSLWCFNTHNKTELSLLNNNLVLEFEDYVNHELFMTFLGKNDIVNTINLLLDLTNKDIVKELRMIPEENIIEKLTDLTKQFKIIEDANNFDYILNIEALSTFQGNKYYDKRNLVNRFKKNYLEHKIEIYKFDPSLNEKKLLLDFFEVWRLQAHGDLDSVRNEKEALSRLFELRNTDNLYIFKVLYHNDLIGFSISEVIDSNYVLIHFEKTNKTYEGTSSYLMQEYCKYYKNMNIKFVNYEQDLGLENLRKAKQLLRPVTYLRKYIIRKS